MPCPGCLLNDDIEKNKYERENSSVHNYVMGSYSSMKDQETGSPPPYALKPTPLAFWSRSKTAGEKMLSV